MSRTIAALTAILAIAPIASATIIIDEFNDTNAAWPATLDAVGFVENTELGLGDVLGGQRYSRLELTAIDSGIEEVSLTVAPMLGEGVLDFASTVGADGNLGLGYDGGGALVADFSAELFIAVDLADFDRAGGAAMPVTIELTSGAGSATQTLNATGGPQTLVYSLGAFSTMGAFDLSDIRSVSVLLDPDFAGDFRINSIIADVPAPGVLALLGVGLLAGARRRRTI